jgi:hypothetical protein
MIAIADPFLIRLLLGRQPPETAEIAPVTRSGSPAMTDQIGDGRGSRRRFQASKEDRA